MKNKLKPSRVSMRKKPELRAGFSLLMIGPIRRADLQYIFFFPYTAYIAYKAYIEYI